MLRSPQYNPYSPPNVFSLNLKTTDIERPKQPGQVKYAASSPSRVEATTTQVKGGQHLALCNITCRDVSI